MMVFLTSKSCRILYSEASEQPHRCSSHSNTLLTHMLHARSHWFLSAPGLVCCSSTLHSEFTPSAWRNQKPLLTLGEGGMQSAESRTRGLGWRGRKKKQQPPKPPRTWKTNPPEVTPRVHGWARDTAQLTQRGWWWRWWWWWCYMGLTQPVTALQRINILSPVFSSSF